MSNWFFISSELPSLISHIEGYNPEDKTMVFRGVDGRVYISEDGARVMPAIPEGMPSTVEQAIPVPGVVRTELRGKFWGRFSGEQIIIYSW